MLPYLDDTRPPAVEFQRTVGPDQERRMNGRQPPDARTYLERGLAFARRGDLDEALTNFNESLDLAPDQPETHFHRGHALAALGRLAEAIAAFDEALRLDPELAPVYLARGPARAEAGDLEGALADYDALLARRPG